MSELKTSVTPQARVGRKTRYSPALIRRLCGYIESGLNISQACAACSLGVSTLRDWRKEYEGLEEKLEAAREILRSKVLAKIRDAGKDDWRAHAEFLRLAFPELRYGNGPSTVNVAVQSNVNMADTDPERANLIKQLEASRERALADKSEAIDAQLADAPDARREIVLAAERNLQSGRSAEAHHAEPERLREQPPANVVERAELIEERQTWREAARAARRDEVDEILGD